MNKIEMLRYFSARADEMGKCRLLKRGFKAELTLHFEIMKPPMFTEAVVDNDDFRSFLTYLRPFVSEDEPVYVNRIANVCWKHLRDEKLKGFLKEARRQWKESLKSGPFKLKISNQLWTPEHTTKLIINGYYFHCDQEKREILEAIPESAKPLIRHQFLDHVIVAVKYVMYVKNLITVAFRDNHFVWS